MKDWRNVRVMDLNVGDLVDIESVSGVLKTGRVVSKCRVDFGCFEIHVQGVGVLRLPHDKIVEAYL